MNIQNKTLRVLGTVGGVFFSILLVGALLVSLFFSMAVSITKPETIVSVVKELDFTEQLLENDAVNSILEAEKIDTAVLDDLADTRFFEEVIEKYTDELIDSIHGDEDDFRFTTETIQRYADKHMDDLVELVRDYMPANEKATDEQIERAINDVISEYGANIVDALPSGEEVSEMIGDLDAEQPLLLLTSSAAPIVLYSFCAVLAILVFVCLLHKFRGLLCVGIDAVIAAALTLIPYLMLSENGLVRSLLEDTEVADILDPILTILADKMLVHLVILAVVGILFIAGYVIYVVLTKKPPVPHADELPAAAKPTSDSQIPTPVANTAAPAAETVTENAP